MSPFIRRALTLVLPLVLVHCKAHGEPPASEVAAALAPSAEERGTGNAWLEIDRRAFESNVRTLQKRLGDKTKICAIMKADAYGHSIRLLMPAVVASGLPCVGIASNEEARLVREGKFTGRLVRVRTGTPDEVEGALAHDVEELAGNVAYARILGAIATRGGKTLRVHLDLNASGMNRNGIELSTAQGKTDALELVKVPGLEVVGIMTHFPVEEPADVKRMLAVFLEQTEWIFANTGLDRKKVTRHCANSYATLEVPETHLDMVRPGGALYGDTVPSYTEYKKVMQFKSRVATVNPYPAGSTVGYDRTFVLKRDSRLANIPAGYSDGYRRVFSNKAHVLIQGHRFPIVGRVSMNTLMVDVTDAPDGIRPGDEVVLFGKQGTAEITQVELEKSADTILVDLYTVWGYANPRILKAE